MCIEYYHKPPQMSKRQWPISQLLLKNCDANGCGFARLGGASYDVFARRHLRGKCAAPNSLAHGRSINKPPEPGVGRHFSYLADYALLKRTCDEMKLRAVFGLHERECGMTLFY